jgi:hypothetical protein
MAEASADQLDDQAEAALKAGEPSAVYVQRVETSKTHRTACLKAAALVGLYRASEATLSGCDDVFQPLGTSVSDLTLTPAAELTIRLPPQLETLTFYDGPRHIVVLVGPTTKRTITLAVALNHKYMVAAQIAGSCLPATVTLDKSQVLDLGFSVRLAPRLAGREVLLDDKPLLEGAYVAFGTHEARLRDNARCVAPVDAERPTVDFADACFATPPTQRKTLRFGASGRADFGASGAGGLLLQALLRVRPLSWLAADAALGPLIAGSAVGPALTAGATFYPFQPLEIAGLVDLDALGLHGDELPHRWVFGVHPHGDVRLRWQRTGLAVVGSVGWFDTTDKNLGNATETRFVTYGGGLDWEVP